MTLTDTQRLDAATRMIRAVTGELYGDGMIVTDVGIGYANGGSGYCSDVWVLGDWNNKTRYEYRDARPTALGVIRKRVIVSNLPSRLFDALERISVNGEWCDEWMRCENCQRLIRTESDSYGWTPQYVDNSAHGEYPTCHDCAVEGLPGTLADYVNDESRAVTWLSESQLSEHGWTDAFPDDYDAASGFHPGQDDKPADMVARLRDSGDERDYLFVITDKGQFDVHWRMMVRDDSRDNDTETDA